MIESVSERRASVEDAPTQLPADVSADEWADERDRLQDTRIQTLMASMEALEKAVDSRRSILHCSSDRLRDIWHQVRIVNAAVRNRIAPLLQQPSIVPALEVAVDNSRKSLSLLTEPVLPTFDSFAKTIRPESPLELRQAICTSVDQLRAFLQGTLEDLMAADPRTASNKEYFLSKRFSRDAGKSERLLRNISCLDEYLHATVGEFSKAVSPFLRELLVESSLPKNEEWTRVEDALALVADLTAKLSELVARQGARADEIGFVKRCAQQLDSQSQCLVETYKTGCQTIEAIRSPAGTTTNATDKKVVDGNTCQAVFSRRIATLAHDLNDAVFQLSVFTQRWRTVIEKRRALTFCQRTESIDKNARPGYTGPW
jgi:hypothetical protein